MVLRESSTPTHPLHIEAGFFRTYDEILKRWDQQVWEIHTDNKERWQYWQRIHVDATAKDVGTFLASLLSYKLNNEPKEFSKLHAFERLDLLCPKEEDEGHILAGGLRFVVGETEILPSCCAGLEGWTEWKDFLAEGHLPWMGHDPAPLLEDRGDSLLLWEDGGLSGNKSGSGASLQFTRGELQQQLQQVAAELQGFGDCVTAWLRDLDYPRWKVLGASLACSFSWAKNTTSPGI